MGTKVELAGRRFGRLFVIHDTGKRNSSKKIVYLCKCDCGKQIEVVGGSLLHGDTKSCGCLKTDRSTKHGGCNSRLYRIWACMLSRCRSATNDGYKFYGAKGVRVCDGWVAFKNFQSWAHENGYADTLTIDRIDPTGNYEPSNCRWATRTQQDRNRRNSKLVQMNGELINLKDVSEMHQINYGMLAHRFNIGVRDARILSPYQRGKKFE